MPSSKNWFTDQFLTPVVAIFLLILLFVTGFASVNYYRSQVQNRNEAQQTKLNLGDTSKLFKSDIDRQRFNQFIGLNEYGKAFIFLSGEYSGAPSNDKREALIKIADFIKANLPDQAKNTDLMIPCRDETCGAVFAYSDKLTQLKNALAGNESLDKILKESLLQNIENASLAAGKGNKDSEFNSLLTVFYRLRREWQSTSNVTFRELSQQTLLVLEETHKDLYDLVKAKGQLNL